jgi:hypothetical protein
LEPIREYLSIRADRSARRRARGSRQPANKYRESETAALRFDKVFEEYRPCDDLGLHIVTNVHHSGINNLWTASPVIPGIVARLTEKGPQPVDLTR